MTSFYSLLYCIIIRHGLLKSVVFAPDPTRRRVADGLMYQFDPAQDILVDNQAKRVVQPRPGGDESLGHAFMRRSVASSRRSGGR